MPSLTLEGTRKAMRRTATSALNKGRKLTELFTNSFNTRTCEEDLEEDELRVISTIGGGSSRRRTIRAKSVLNLLDEAPNFFDLLERLQSGRLEDQRCFLPVSGCSEILGVESEIPSEEASEVINNQSEHLDWVIQKECDLESLLTKENGINEDEDALIYRKYFLNQPHYNFSAKDEELGPILISLKPETQNSQEYWRIIIRLKNESFHEFIPVSLLDLDAEDSNTICKTSLAYLLKIINGNDGQLAAGSVSSTCPQCTNLILEFDEHSLVSNYKFGVLYQRDGQVTEEDIFSNQHSDAFNSFLENLGSQIQLRNHKGYSGGLDTNHGETGETSVYTIFNSKEVMFHISTFLPFSEINQQQIERKRHIGNDIVVIIFQDADTHFSPEIITSSFIHAFIVVQLIDSNNQNKRYKLSVITRKDVPCFGPSLPNPPIFSDGQEFYEFLLTKLINAENACYQSEKFAKLRQRTRETLLKTLLEKLGNKSEANPAIIATTPKTRTKYSMDNNENITTHNFNERIRRVLTSSKIGQEMDSPNLTTKLTPRISTLGESLDFTEDTISTIQSNNNVNLTKDNTSTLESIEEEALISSPTMSICTENYQIENITLTLKNEMNQLKLEKLSLLQINLKCQKEMIALRSKEIQLGTELAVAKSEIKRLKNLLQNQSSLKYS